MFLRSYTIDVRNDEEYLVDVQCAIRNRKCNAYNGFSRFTLFPSNLSIFEVIERTIDCNHLFSHWLDLKPLGNKSEKKR